MSTIIALAAIIAYLVMWWRFAVEYARREATLYWSVGRSDTALALLEGLCLGSVWPLAMGVRHVAAKIDAEERNR